MIRWSIDTASYSINTQVAICQVNQRGVGQTSFLSPKDGNSVDLAAVSTPQGACIAWTQRRIKPDKRDQPDPNYPMRLQGWMDRDSPYPPVGLRRSGAKKQ